jgi:sulfite reductase (NADPH) flavoprotein alpha-component
MIIGITGAILSFEKEILSYINKNIYTVNVPNTDKIPINTLLKEIQKQKSNILITSVKFSNLDSYSLLIQGVNQENQKKFKYNINPYTAKVLAEEQGVSFFRTVENIHRKLLLKDFGKQVVGISVIGFFILLLSGVYLSLVKLKKQFLASFIFTFKSKGQYFLSTMHSAIGMWLVPFYVLSIFTGLNWSYSWYNNTFYKVMNVEKSKRYIIQKVENRNNYSIDNLTKAINLFDSKISNKYEYSFVKVPKSGSIYSFLYMDKNAKHRRERNKILLDIETGEILKHERFENKPLKEQIMISMLTLHTGEYFGVYGQILMFIVALFLPFLGITGFFLFMKKRRKKKFKTI